MLFGWIFVAASAAAVAAAVHVRRARARAVRIGQLQAAGPAAVAHVRHELGRRLDDLEVLQREDDIRLGAHLTAEARHVQRRSRDFADATRVAEQSGAEEDWQAAAAAAQKFRTAADTFCATVDQRMDDLRAGEAEWAAATTTQHALHRRVERHRQAGAGRLTATADAALAALADDIDRSHATAPFWSEALAAAHAAADELDRTVAAIHARRDTAATFDEAAAQLDRIESVCATSADRDHVTWIHEQLTADRRRLPDVRAAAAAVDQLVADGRLDDAYDAIELVTDFERSALVLAVHADLAAASTAA